MDEWEIIMVCKKKVEKTKNENTDDHNMRVLLIHMLFWCVKN